MFNINSNLIVADNCFVFYWFVTDRGEPRRRLHRIVRNSLWLFLTHYATPPLPQKSRSARLFGCKRPLDGSLSLPTFADLYIAFSRELSFISDNLTAAASHRPTPWDIKSIFMNSPTYNKAPLKQRSFCHIIKSIELFSLNLSARSWRVTPST